MNIKEIRQLVKLMVDNDLTELNIGEGENKVHLKRGPEGVQVIPAPQASAVAPAAPHASPAPVETPPAGASESAEAPADNLIEIRSPMVGTFYTASSPDSEPFVQVGAGVNEDSVVCIVEAMKVMNEIKAECRGTIAEVCVENAQPVEYGQVLFRVTPA